MTTFSSIINNQNKKDVFIITDINIYEYSLKKLVIAIIAEYLMKITYKLR